MEHKLKYSVIIPTLNAQKYLDRCLGSVRDERKDVEIIVVDGGSIDRTSSIATQYNASVKHSARGRGYQLNQGVLHATGDVYLFLHADTLLPEGAFDILDEYFTDQENKISTFKLRFDQNHWLLDFYGNMTKYDSLWTSFGDQGIAVRPSFYQFIGGFPHWRLFEDVEFLKKARRKTKISSLDAQVTTSAEKFLKNGFFRHQMKNGWLILKYLFGVSPERLSYEYNH